MLLNGGVGEDSWESLDSKEIHPVHPRWNQSWIFIGRTDAEGENTLATWCKELTHWKRPWCWEIFKAGEEGDKRWWDGWMASPTQQTWVWASSSSWWWTGKPGMLQPMRLQRVRHHWVIGLNWTEAQQTQIPVPRKKPETSVGQKYCLHLNTGWHTGLRTLLCVCRVGGEAAQAHVQLARDWGSR